MIFEAPGSTLLVGSSPFYSAMFYSTSRLSDPSRSRKRNRNNFNVDASEMIADTGLLAVLTNTNTSNYINNNNLNNRIRRRRIVGPVSHRLDERDELEDATNRTDVDNNIKYCTVESSKTQLRSNKVAIDSRNDSSNARRKSIPSSFSRHQKEENKIVVSDDDDSASNYFTLEEEGVKVAKILTVLKL